MGRRDYLKFVETATRMLTSVPALLTVPAWMKRLVVLKERRQVIAIVGDKVQVEWEGVSLHLDLNESHDYVIYREFRRGIPYEPGCVAVLKSELRPGDTFVDVGANNGYFSLLASQLVGTGGHVYAVEPGPSAQKRLELNLQRNGLSNRVYVMKCALTDTEGVRVLYLSERDDALNSFDRTSRRSIQVPTSRLDQVIGETPSFVKIDVEGSEHLVLSGMDRHLRSPSPPRLIVEWNRATSGKACWRILRDTYKVYRIWEDPSLDLLERVRDPSDLPEWCNVYCSSDDLV